MSQRNDEDTPPIVCGDCGEPITDDNEVIGDECYSCYLNADCPALWCSTPHAGPTRHEYAFVCEETGDVYRRINGEWYGIDNLFFCGSCEGHYRRCDFNMDYDQCGSCVEESERYECDDDEGGEVVGDRGDIARCFGAIPNGTNYSINPCGNHVTHWNPISEHVSCESCADAMFELIPSLTKELVAA